VPQPGPHVSDRPLRRVDFVRCHYFYNQDMGYNGYAMLYVEPRTLGSFRNPATKLLLADMGSNNVADTGTCCWSMVDDWAYTPAAGAGQVVAVHGTGYNMAFLDGHAQFMTGEAFAALNSWND